LPFVFLPSLVMSPELSSVLFYRSFEGCRENVTQ
jgi:hypothetical protein